jgi:hypothetical protein
MLFAPVETTVEAPVCERSSTSGVKTARNHGNC